MTPPDEPTPAATPAGQPVPPTSPAPPGPPTTPPPPPRRQRKWLPTFSVFLVMMFVTLGGFFAAGGAADQIGTVTDPGTPAPDAAPIEVAAGVSITPLEGWVQGDAPEPYSARITNGTGFLDVVSNDQASDPAELVQRYVTEILQPAATQMQASSPEPIAVDVALPAARSGYVGLFTGQSQSIEGEVTAVILPDGTGVVFDGWAAEGMLGVVRDAIRQMIGAMKVG